MARQTKQLVDKSVSAWKKEREPEQTSKKLMRSSVGADLASRTFAQQRAAELEQEAGFQPVFHNVMRQQSWILSSALAT